MTQEKAEAYALTNAMPGMFNAMLEAYKAGHAEALPKLDRIHKWLNDNWIPSPKHDDSFWQNRLIAEIRKLLPPLGGERD